MTSIIPLTKIGFFNPGRLTDEEIEQSFIARLPFFEFIFKKVVAEKPDSIPQHYLIIGQRGMGKTSLLIRIAAELRKTLYKSSFIPLSFPEEQYNVDRLSKFWLNCLDALADALDKEHQAEILKGLDTEIDGLSKEKSLDANAVYKTFEKWISKLNRRPVLLVDNLNLILSKINKEEQHQLRAILMSEGAPILVGASATTIEETVDYGAPFYDAFQINYLKKLSFQESLDILLNLAKITGIANFADHLYSKKGRVEALYQLTGGTPRTIAILFPLIQNGFSEAIQTDLDALLDVVTPLYKARFEELAHQLQIVLDAVALHWDPINLEQLRETTLLENQQLSPQLKRLVDVGWLQKLDAYEAKGGAYELSERFFNIWYLMRRSSRRQKRELYCLTKFLESFYGADLQEIAKARINHKSENVNQIALDLALADAIKEPELRERLKNKSYETLVILSQDNEEILNNFSVPQSIKEQKVKELLDKISSQFEKLEYQEVEKTLKGVIKIDNKNIYALSILGDLYLNHLKKYDEVESILKKAITLNEKFAYPWNSLGNYYSDYLKRYDEAENFYKKAIELDKLFPFPWNGLGTLYKDHLKRYKESEHAYKKAIELDKSNVFFWSGLGDLYSNYLGRYQDAEDIFKKIINLNNDLAYPWSNLADLYVRHLGKYAEAEQAYKKAIELDKKSSYYWFGLGNLYKSHLGRYIEAEQSYKKAIELDGNLTRIWNDLGNLYMSNLEKYQEAEQSYKRAIELDKGSVHPWNGLGVLYSKILGQHQKAEYAYNKAIEIDEKYVYSWIGLGDLYISLGRYQEAEQVYKKAIELDETKIPDWNILGNLYFDFLSNYTEAEKIYLKALSINSNNNYAKYNLTFLWRDKMGKSKEAKELFNTIEKSDEIKDSHLLSEALFAYYEKNAGIAENFFKEALLTVGDILPSHTLDDWYRSAAVIIKLGFTSSLLNTLSSTGHNIMFRPLYVAIEAIAKKDDLYFNSIAAEVREPAKKIMERIEAYMK